MAKTKVQLIDDITGDVLLPETSADQVFMNSGENLEEKIVDIDVQADWNQNDPAAHDYIKHRTHYEETATASLEWDTDVADTSRKLYLNLGGNRVTLNPYTGLFGLLYWRDVENNWKWSVTVGDTMELWEREDGENVRYEQYDGFAFATTPQPFDLGFGEGTTIHKLDNKFLDMDSEPTTGSNKPVTSGGVKAAIADFVTRAVNDLLNYYTKTETYTKAEVNQLVAGINNWEIVSVAQLPEATADTMHKIYLVPSSNPETRNVKDEFITVEVSGAYSWEQIGTTAIDLTNYVTKQELTAALADYVTSVAFTQALALKQDVIEDLQAIRQGASLGATAYQKPSLGIPKTDMSTEVQDTLGLADSALQSTPSGEIDPNVTPADFATREELEGEVSQLRSEVDGLDVTITEADVTSVAGRWANNDGVIGTGNSGVLHRADAINLDGISSFNLSTYMSWAAVDAAFLCDDSGNILETIPRLPSPGDPTVITGKAVPTGVTKLYVNFASSFIFEGVSPGIEEKFDDKLQEFEDEVDSQIDARVESATAEAIDNYQEQYGAVEIVENSTPMPLTENDFVLGNLNDYGVEISGNNVIRSDYIRIVPGANYTFSTVNNYRCRIYCFDKDKNYILSSAILWKTGTYQGIFPSNADYIRILVASPAGTTTAPVWANIGLSFTVSKVYQYGRAAAESQIETALEQYFNIELPILGPSPQLPADGDADSDFNAETMTSTEIQSAIESQINKLSVPNVGVNSYTPKYGTIYETIGKDASGLYDIKAYVFTRRNRFAWRASAALYAWKSGSTTYYTDHRSPLVGDTVYSNNTRTDSGYTVTAYNSAGPSITVNGNTYTRDDFAKVDATDIFTQAAPGATTTSIAAYNKSGASVGTATVSSPTQIVLGGKTYTRLSSGDFHTENKATIVIWGNEHGPQSDPNEPSIIIYRLIKDLCECGGGEFIKFLRKYCKLVFIPAANPYGINKFVSEAREGRTNANNVNINRNYDTVGWGVQTDSNKGSYAGDQPETQFIMNTALDVAADIAIDIHCLGYNSTPLNEGRTHYEGYVSALNGKVAEIMVGYCGHSYTSYGDADPSTKATGADWIYSLGIAGGIIEMNAGPYAVSYDGKQHKAGIMFTDYTLLLNVIRMWYYNFDPSLDLSRMSIK